MSAPASTRRSKDEPKRDDIETICNLLVELMIDNGCRKPVVTKKWRDAARLLLDHDKVPFDQALAILRWSQTDEFWKANIQSLPKFRAKFDTLRLQAERSGARLATDATSVDDWLRKCWTNADTTSVTERSGLDFQPPDIPEDVTDVRAFSMQARRDWITRNRDAITNRIRTREAS